MADSRVPAIPQAPTSKAAPSLAEKFLLSLWVFSYAALLQIFHLVRRMEGDQKAGKQPAGAM